MNSLAYLNVIAASLLMSACGSWTRIVPISLPPPPVCLELCPAELAEPPQVGDDLGRRLWEIDMMTDYGSCQRLNQDCKTALEGQKPNDNP